MSSPSWSAGHKEPAEQHQESDEQGIQLSRGLPGVLALCLQLRVATFHF